MIEASDGTHKEVGTGGARRQWAADRALKGADAFVGSAGRSGPRHANRSYVRVLE